MADIPGTIVVGPEVVENFYGGGRNLNKPGGILRLGITGGDTTPPVIDNFDPVVGTPLARNASVRFDVTDEISLRRVIVLATLGGETYVVHDGFAFRGDFSNLSTRSAIANGWRYTVKRNGGWVDAPTFEVCAIDTSGNEAS